MKSNVFNISRDVEVDMKRILNKFKQDWVR